MDIFQNAKRENFSKLIQAYIIKVAKLSPSSQVARKIKLDLDFKKKVYDVGWVLIAIKHFIQHFCQDERNFEFRNFHFWVGLVVLYIQHQHIKNAPNSNI